MSRLSSNAGEEQERELREKRPCTGCGRHPRELAEGTNEETKNVFSAEAFAHQLVNVANAGCACFVLWLLIEMHRVNGRHVSEEMDSAGGDVKELSISMRRCTSFRRIASVSGMMLQQCLGWTRPTIRSNSAMRGNSEPVKSGSRVGSIDIVAKRCWPGPSRSGDEAWTTGR